MSIQVIRPGLLTTIQDSGRYGYQKYGVIASGAMDLYSLRLANILVGNHENEAALEITLLGPALQLTENALIAITGGDLSPTVNGQPLPLWRPIYVKKGCTIKFGACKTGCRAYLAVAGGYDIPEVMDSQSTYLRAGIGGYQGRALQAGDRLDLKPLQAGNDSLIQAFPHVQEDANFAAPSWYASQEHIRTAAVTTVRIMRGIQYEQFSASSHEALWRECFQVTTQSDRMGYRLTGPSLQLAQPMEMISEAITLGTIQVPPDGNPIILLADRQTAGGYPKIGQVALVDVDKVAQVRPGGSIQFQEISVAEAEQLYLEREQTISHLYTSIRLKLGLPFR